MEAEPLAVTAVMDDVPAAADAEMRIDYGDNLDDAEMGEAQPTAETSAPLLEEAVMGDASEQPAVDSISMEVVQEATEMDSTRPPVGAAEEQQHEAETSMAATESALHESAIDQEQASAAVDSAEGSALLPPESLPTSLPPAPTFARALGNESVPSIKVHPPAHRTDEGSEQIASGDVEGAEGEKVEEPTRNGHAVEQEQPVAELVEQKQAETIELVDEVQEPIEAAQTVGEEQNEGAGEGEETAEVVESSEWAQADDQQLEEQQFVEVITIGEECPTCAASSKSIRPSLETSLLALVDLPPVPSSSDGDSSTLTAPTVLLSYQDEYYSVFRRGDVRRGEQTETETLPDVPLDSSLPVLFEQADKHELYYDQVERFIEALRGLFPELESEAEELLLEFPELGVSLPEDNIYTRQVTLEDLHRVHVGCGLGGSLLLQLITQPRFASGFNALARHIGNSRSNNLDLEASDELAQDDEPPTEEPISTQDEAAVEEQSNQNDGEEEQVENSSAETFEQEGEYEPPSGNDEHYEDGEWHDEDLVYEEGAIEQEGGEGDDTQEEQHELEEALADMDSDDLNAYIEGVQEDFVVSQEALEHEGGGAGEGDEAVAEEVVVGQEGDGEDEQGGDTATEDQVIVQEEQQQDPSADLDLAISTLPPPPPIAAAPSSPVVISYDTPLGTGNEPPSVPLDSLDAVVDAATASTKLDPSPLGQHTEAVNGDPASVDSEEPTEEPSADVVIDYEEVEATVESVPAPLPSSNDPPRSPKRAREDPEGEVPELGAESAAGDIKRPRLSDPEVEPSLSPA